MPSFYAYSWCAHTSSRLRNAIWQTYPKGEHHRVWWVCFPSCVQFVHVSLGHTARRRWVCVRVGTIASSSGSILPASSLVSCAFTIDSPAPLSLGHKAAMFFSRGLTLPSLLVCFLLCEVARSYRRCGQDICRDDQICCAPGNDTSAVTCCRQRVDNTYYNIAMVTRKLSGVLIMLLLFALGYFVQRVLCSRSRQLTPPPPDGPPAVTTSQDPLVESYAAEGPLDPAPVAQLPSYEECKCLPTYEETVREGNRARPGYSSVQTT